MIEIMPMKSPKTGFTLVETVVAIGVFSLFFAAIAVILQQVLENVGQSRVRALALSVGQEKMEIVRNLPYASVGTIGGVPSGPIAQTEVVNYNNNNFTVVTSILYIDDPFDGSAPSDAISADYKRARIQITWGGQYPSRFPVTLVTNIVPKGIESNPGGGTLTIQVLNSQGLPVGNANVTIKNTLVTPNIDLSTLTGADGIVNLPGSPACISCYNITVSKPTYSTDKTYTTTEVANPIQSPPSLLEGNVTRITFSIDQVGNLTLHSRGSEQAGYPPLANVLFSIHGKKIIGYDTSDNPVYKYNFQTTTGGGNVGIPNLEWDIYTIDLSNSNYSLAGSSPPNPITILPGSSNDMILVTDTKYANSLSVTVKNQLGELLSPAKTTLISSPSGTTVINYTAATGSANAGQTFFNNLLQGTYLLFASMSGYQEASSSLTLAGNQQTTVILTP